jgi:hypothetical protein
MNLGWLIPGVALALTLGGGQQCYVSMTSHKQQSMSLAEFEKKTPASRWLRLEHCRVSTSEVKFGKPSGDMNAAYLPVYPAGEKNSQPAKILLKTYDKVFLALGKDPGTDQLARLTALTELLAMQSNDMTVEGLVYTDIPANASERSKVDQLGVKLDKDYILIDHHKAPAFVDGGIAMLVIGMAGLVFWGVRAGKSAARVSPPT